MKQAILTKKTFGLILVLLLSTPISASIAVEGGIARAITVNTKTLGIGPSIVSINGRQLLVRKRNPDGTLTTTVPYVIKGVCWAPASRNTNTSPTDSNNAKVRRKEFVNWNKKDIPLLKQMNVNTVRTFIDMGFDSTAKSILDELYCHDIMVIMTVDDAINNMARVRQAVEFYKNHPAILMWMVGNEWNINRYYGVARSVLDAAQRTETAARLIKTIDSNHPVATSYGAIDINGQGLRLPDTQNYVTNVSSSVDVWGLNIYRGGNFSALFPQWKSISNKPIFLSEFGTDAFRSIAPVHPPQGAIDESMQAQWDTNLWNIIFRNLSVIDSSKVALGGTVFEWNDEWWKVSPPGSQQPNGFILFNGHPDNFANEEYFGIVDIDRQKRGVYDSLKIAFDPIYQAPALNVAFKAQSAGYNVTINGFAEFFRDDALFYSKTGGAGGGRGFNIAAIDITKDDLIPMIRHYDTWATSGTGTEMIKMISFLDSLKSGTMIMIAIADEAGLTESTGNLLCTKLSRSWVANCIQTLEALGSTKIRRYCFRNSWAMIAVKGEGRARDEQLGSTNVVSVQTTIKLPPSQFLRMSPSAPTLVLPSNNSKEVSTNPTLAWNVSSATTSYHLQVSTDSTFLRPVFDLLGIPAADTSRSIGGLRDKTTYYWRVNASNSAGASRWSCIWSFITTQITAINDQEDRIPTVFSLSQNYPNPFNPSTTIRYAIPKTGYVKLKVLSLLGEEMITLVNGAQAAGEYEIQLHAGDLPSGIYVYRLEAVGFIATRKLVLLR